MKIKKAFLIWICVAIMILVCGVLWKVKTQEITSNEMVNDINVSNSEQDFNEIITISQINENMKGTVVSIQAKVTDIKEHQNGHLFLTVEDNTGNISVPIFANTDINQDIIKKDNTYKISGEVDIYNGYLEIIPQSQKDISIIEETTVTNELAITRENIDKQVSINCTILTKYNHPKGHIFLNVLTDNNEEIEVPIFNTLGYSQENTLNSGTYIKVTGKISEYNGSLEVIPNTKDDIEIISVSASENVELVLISDITENDRGKMVQVRGIPTDLVEENGHLFFYLQDNQYKIKAVLFKADGDEIEGRKLKLKHYASTNRAVRVLGSVDVYNNELEIIIDKVFNKD